MRGAVAGGGVALVVVAAVALIVWRIVFVVAVLVAVDAVPVVVFAVMIRSSNDHDNGGISLGSHVNRIIMTMILNSNSEICCRRRRHRCC